MIIKSNPFLRNDYYPDQNDIDELNTRINEVQSDVDLLAISVNEKTEAVNGRLNNLQNDYNESFETEALKANIASLNVLNVNVQATIKDLNAVNTYIENLIVNKPVQDLSLRTPHLENTTSLNGNFYAPNILGGVFDNIQIENMQNFKAINIEADRVKANTVDLNTLNAVNIKTDEVTANIANLKDLNATNIQVDKVTANTIDLNVLNAVNIEANEVKANKLIGDFFSVEPITSAAVVGYDENGQLIPIRASYDVSPDVSLPEDSDYLKTDAHGIARKGTSESGVVQSTNLIQAGAVQNMYDAVNANFNTVNENINNLESSVKTINDFIFSGIYLPEYGSFNSSSPVNYLAAKTVELYGNAQGGSALPDGSGLIKFDSSTNTVTFGFSGAACKGIINAYSMFLGCSELNQNILVPKSVVDANSMFFDCSALNQNILIPNSVENTDSMFYRCTSLNQNILIPNSVVDAKRMFFGCTSLNQNILVPKSVKSTNCMFFGCSVLNQNILVPNSVVDATRMFFGCSFLNQDIYIYSQNLSRMNGMFTGTRVNKHNVHIPSSVPKDTSNYIYKSLVSGETGPVFAAENIINDLPW